MSAKHEQDLQTNVCGRSLSFQKWGKTLSQHKKLQKSCIFKQNWCTDVSGRKKNCFKPLCKKGYKLGGRQSRNDVIESSCPLPEQWEGTNHKLWVFKVYTVYCAFKCVCVCVCMCASCQIPIAHVLCPDHTLPDAKLCSRIRHSTCPGSELLPSGAWESTL